MLIVIVIKFQTFYINPWVKSVQQPHFQFFISFLCRTGLKGCADDVVRSIFYPKYQESVWTFQ